MPGQTTTNPTTGPGVARRTRTPQQLLGVQACTHRWAHKHRHHPADRSQAPWQPQGQPQLVLQQVLQRLVLRLAAPCLPELQPGRRRLPQCLQLLSPLLHRALSHQLVRGQLLLHLRRCPPLPATGHKPPHNSANCARCWQHSTWDACMHTPMKATRTLQKAGHAGSGKEATMPRQLASPQAA